MKIEIIKDGPYFVTGNVPLKEVAMIQDFKGNEYKTVRDIEHASSYALCRCGHSKNMPFCDGSHECMKFDGTTKASKEPLKKQAKKYKGPNLILEDVENLCAFARFCHYANEDVWNLVETAQTVEEEELAIKLACDCPAGRLVIKEKGGDYIEPAYDKEIAILQDIGGECSGPIWVKGGIAIVDENGEEYEVRNRVTLCRCGHSKNMPFCDAHHVEMKFKDKYFK